MSWTKFRDFFVNVFKAPLINLLFVFGVVMIVAGMTDFTIDLKWLYMKKQILL